MSIIFWCIICKLFFFTHFWKLLGYFVWLQGSEISLLCLRVTLFLFILLGTEWDLLLWKLMSFGSRVFSWKKKFFKCFPPHHFLLFMSRILFFSYWIFWVNPLIFKSSLSHFSSPYLYTVICGTFFLSCIFWRFYWSFHFCSQVSANFQGLLLFSENNF